MEIIGITGFAQHGKDTVANYFIQRKGFVKRALADAIKEGCKGVFGFTEEQVNGSKKDVVDEFWGITPRKVLQVFGTEIFRQGVGNYWPELQKIGQDFWIKRMEKFILESNHDKIVIPDIRFENEVELIKKYKGDLVKVKRGERIIQESNHASEKGVDDKHCDYIVENNGTIEDLYRYLDTLWG